MRTLLTVLLITICCACRNNYSLPPRDRVLPMCNWFPVVYNAEYIYAGGKMPKNNAIILPTFAAACTDTSITIADMSFSCRNCNKLTLMFGSFQNAMLLHKDVNADTIWIDTVMGGRRYKTWQERSKPGQTRDTITLHGVKYAYRRACAAIVDSLTGESTTITVHYADDKGIVLLSKETGEDAYQYRLKSTSQ